MSDVYDSVHTMIDKEELLKLLTENFTEQAEQDEALWDEMYENGDDETVVYDKGWQSGFAYAIYLIRENW